MHIYIYVTKRKETKIFPCKIALMALMPDISGLIINKRDIMGEAALQPRPPFLAFVGAQYKGCRHMQI